MTGAMETLPPGERLAYSHQIERAMGAGFSRQAINAAIREVLVKCGLRVGSSLENRVTLLMRKWDFLDGWEMQYRVGRYRLDYAHPRWRVAIEADGIYHWHPENAVRDLMRDSWLRSEGWLVFRVDDENGNLDEQVSNTIRAIRRITA